MTRATRLSRTRLHTNMTMPQTRMKTISQIYHIIQTLQEGDHIHTILLATHHIQIRRATDRRPCYKIY